MIVRKCATTTYLTPQPDHGWASGELARLLADDFIDPEHQEDLISVVAHHDDGWSDWEDQPKLHPSGCPFSFSEIDSSEHEAIWRRGIDIVARHIGPYAGAILALHAQGLTEGDCHRFRDYLTATYLKLSRQAMPASDPTVREWKLERGFHALRLCDLLTLMPCAGWEGPLTTTLIEESSQRRECVIRGSGEWELEVKGWPFVLDRIEVTIPLLKVRDEDFEGAVRALHRGKREQQILVIHPA